MEKKMNRWIEIIGVRLFSPSYGDVIREIFTEVTSGICEVEGKAVAAELFANENVETDWSIYLYRNRSDGSPSKTQLGLNIAEVFHSLGLVNHSVWTMDLMKKETYHE